MPCAWATAMLRTVLKQTDTEDLVVEVAMQRSQHETGARQLAALEIDQTPLMAMGMPE